MLEKQQLFNNFCQRLEISTRQTKSASKTMKLDFKTDKSVILKQNKRFNTASSSFLIEPSNITSAKILKILEEQIKEDGSASKIF